MKNGKSIELKSKEVRHLEKIRSSFRVKRDFEKKYNTSIVTLNNIISNRRSCERIYNILFKNK